MRGFRVFAVAVLLAGCAHPPPGPGLATAPSAENWDEWEAELQQGVQAMPHGRPIRLALTLEVADDQTATRLANLLRQSVLVDSIGASDSGVSVGVASVTFGSSRAGRLRVTSHAAETFDRRAVREWLRVFQALPADSAWAVNGVGVAVN